MIKFIATDLDGTLLDDEKRLPREIFGLIGQLQEAGVIFAPASGRQYANLRELFAPVADKLLYICENGALVRYRGETLFSAVIEKERVLEALAAVHAVPRLFPMLCCADCAYVESDELPFYTYATLSYTNCVKVESLAGIAGTLDVCKIAVYDGTGAAERCYPILSSRLPRLRVIQSGPDWCDIASPAADKGSAVRFLRGHFGWKREECAAFGDHMNDYEMLLECGNAFVTENAYPPLKERFHSVIPSNNRGGVVTKLKEIFALGKEERI